MLAYAFEVYTSIILCELLIYIWSHTQAMCGLECGHYFCKECWDSYLKVMVMCEGRSQTIQCPASHCTIIVDEATVLEMLREPEVCYTHNDLIVNILLYTRYERNINY